MDAIIFMIVAYLTMTSMLVLINASTREHYMSVIAFSIMSIFIISPELFKYEGCYIPVVINIVFILSGITSYRKASSEEFITYILNKDDYEILFDSGGIASSNAYSNRECTYIKWKGHTFITQKSIIGKGSMKIICDKEDRVINVEYLNKFTLLNMMMLTNVLLMYGVPMLIYLGYINGDFRMYGDLAGSIVGVMLFLFLLSMMVGKKLVWRVKVLRFCAIVMLILLIINTILQIIIIFK